MCLKLVVLTEAPMGAHRFYHHACPALSAFPACLPCPQVGTKLLAADVKIASRLTGKIAAGKTLTRYAAVPDAACLPLLLLCHCGVPCAMHAVHCAALQLTCGVALSVYAHSVRSVVRLAGCC